MESPRGLTTNKDAPVGLSSNVYAVDLARQSVGRLLGARYAKTGLAVGVAVLLVGTLVAIRGRLAGHLAGSPMYPESVSGPGNATEAETDELLCRGFVGKKVFAVLTHWVSRSLAQCLADNKILALRTGNLIGDDHILAATSPWIWTVGRSRPTRDRPRS